MDIGDLISDYHAQGLPVPPMEQLREEAAADEHNVLRGMWPDVPLPLAPGKTVRQMGCPIKLSDCPPEYRHAGYPAGFHTHEVLKAYGFTEEEIKDISQ